MAVDRDINVKDPKNIDPKTVELLRQAGASGDLEHQLNEASGDRPSTSNGQESSDWPWSDGDPVETKNP